MGKNPIGGMIIIKKKRREMMNIREIGKNPGMLTLHEVKLSLRLI